MANLSVSSLFQYPVKSARGQRLTSMTLDHRGPQDDRRWMIVDHAGEKITQRECPKLAQLCVLGFHLVDGRRLMRIQFDGETSEALPVYDEGDVVMVNVWGDRCEAVRSTDSINEWLSRQLERDVWLVRMKDGFRRHSRSGGSVLNGFADGYPLLITTEASLAELNGHLLTPVPMDRFRPNIVIRGDLEPFEEDEWQGRLLRVGTVTLRVEKPCARCVIVTTDQQTGERTKGEPLKTLARIHRVGKEVLFGVNADHLEQGIIFAGDPVTLLD